MDLDKTTRTDEVARFFDPGWGVGSWILWIALLALSFALVLVGTVGISFILDHLDHKDEFETVTQAIVTAAVSALSGIGGLLLLGVSIGNLTRHSPTFWGTIFFACVVPIAAIYGAYRTLSIEEESLSIAGLFFAGSIGIIAITCLFYDYWNRSAAMAPAALATFVVVGALLAGGLSTWLATKNKITVRSAVILAATGIIWAPLVLLSIPAVLRWLLYLPFRLAS